MTRDISQGDWVVLLYHHDCPKCQDAIWKYRALAQRLALASSSTRVVLVEVPPFESNRKDNSPAIYGQLQDNKEWFVQAPIELQISDSKVIDVSPDLISINDSQRGYESFELAKLTQPSDY